MKIITRKYKVYEYKELSDEAKEKAKQWFLDDGGLRAMDFKEIYEQDLWNLFPTSFLHLQFSLASCQGDGVNVYGELNLDEILNLPTSANADDQFADLKDYFTEKEIKTLRFYMKECTNYIDLPYNSRYCYCYVDRIDMDKWSNYLWWSGYRDINEEVIEKLKQYIIKIFTKLCRNYENYGYDYLYNVDDEEMSETCEANHWYFNKDGSYFAA